MGGVGSWAVKANCRAFLSGRFARSRRGINPGSKGPGLSPGLVTSIFVNHHDGNAWRSVVIRSDSSFKNFRRRYYAPIVVPNMKLE